MSVCKTIRCRLYFDGGELFGQKLCAEVWDTVEEPYEQTDPKDGLPDGSVIETFIGATSEEVRAKVNAYIVEHKIASGSWACRGMI